MSTSAGVGFPVTGCTLFRSMLKPASLYDNTVQYNTAYRADGESFHDWKVCCGCSFEERPRLRPTSSLQQRLGKRRDTEGEGYREHKAILDIKAMERRISEANKPTANDLQRYIDAIDT